MSRAIVIGISCAALLGACAKKQPTSKPVVVEDVLPFGTNVCFPVGMRNESDEVGAELAATVPTTQPAAPEVPR